MQRRSTQRSTAALSVSGRSQQSTSERNSLHSTASKGVSVKFNDWFEAVRKYGALMTRDMVAAALGVSRQRVHQLIYSGKIAAIRVGDHDYVPLAALEIYRSTRVTVPRRTPRQGGDPTREQHHGPSVWHADESFSRFTTAQKRPFVTSRGARRAPLEATACDSSGSRPFAQPPCRWEAESRS